jgi:hypothetical protein
MAVSAAIALSPPAALSVATELSPADPPLSVVEALLSPPASCGAPLSAFVTGVELLLHATLRKQATTGPTAQNRVEEVLMGRT